MTSDLSEPLPATASFTVVDHESVLSPVLIASSQMTCAEQQQQQQQQLLKPFEMNTYVQLTDTMANSQNSCTCVTRVCKFRISKLQLKASIASACNGHVIVAVKLYASKRSLRTLDIPILAAVAQRSTTQSQQLVNVDLNLYYNITYPHYLKKDTNILYVYVQARKKYKKKATSSTNVISGNSGLGANSTSATNNSSSSSSGYKTIAYGYIDISAAMQRPLCKELPLHAGRDSSNRASSSSEMNTGASSLDHPVGYLHIQSMCSQPADLLDEIDSVTAALSGSSPIFTQRHAQSTAAASRDGGVPGEDDEELNEASSSCQPQTASAMAAGIACSDSEYDSETRNKHQKQQQQQQQRQPHGFKSGSKNFTGKIKSFIKKLRNENESENEAPIMDTEVVASSMVRDETLLFNEDDYDIDDIDQISNSSSSSGADPDVYSIVSTPKPRLQPYFNTLLDVDDYGVDEERQATTACDTVSNQNTDNFCYYNEDVFSVSYDEQQQQKVAHESLFKRSLGSFVKSGAPFTEITESKLADLLKYGDIVTGAGELVILFLDTNEPLGSFIVNNSDKLYGFGGLLANSCKMLKQYLEVTLLWLNKNQQQQQQQQYPVDNKLASFLVKIVIVGCDQHLNEYTQLYIELIKKNESLVSQYFKHYYVPNSKKQRGSMLVACMSQLSAGYAALFCDDVWNSLETRLKSENGSSAASLKDIVWSRIVKYYKQQYSSSIVMPNSTYQLHIGEVMINQHTDETTSMHLPFLCEVAVGFPAHHDATTIKFHNPLLEEKASNEADNFGSATQQIQGAIMLPSNSFNQLGNSLPSNKASICSSYPSSSLSSQSPPSSPVIDFRDELAYNLQVDYWTVVGGSSSGGAGAGASTNTSNTLAQSSNLFSKDPQNKLIKASIKALFKNMHVYRTQLIKPKTSTSVASVSNKNSYNLTVVYLAKEKKQKSWPFLSFSFFCFNFLSNSFSNIFYFVVMRLSKKSKECENKRQRVEGLARLVCTSKNLSTPFDGKVLIKFK
jgi:phosphofurin acidic cluster sorting protein 2